LVAAMKLKAALESAQAMHREQEVRVALADAHVALGIMSALQGNPPGPGAFARGARDSCRERRRHRQEKVLGFGGLVVMMRGRLRRGLPR